MLLEATRGNILIIDDDDDLGKMLRLNLKAEGFNVHKFHSINEVDRSILTQMRMVIVNAMTHDFTGLDLLTELKSNPVTEKIPIMLCCMPENEEVILDAFELGVDDFVKKPYSLREMHARINAVLRRYPFEVSNNERNGEEDSESDEIHISHLDLRINTTNHVVEYLGNLIPLTKTEYSIFEFLIKNSENFYTRDQIFSEIWKDDSSVNVRIVDTNISRLRKKLGEVSKCIINRYGLGYAFVGKTI